MKLGLQIILGILSLIPLMVSLSGVFAGLALRLPLEAIDASFDSQFRYITGYYLSLTLTAWWIIPNVERHRTLFRIVAGSIFFGGVGRVLSWVQVGNPGPLSVFFTGLELLFPLLAVWQSYLSKRSQQG